MLRIKLKINFYLLPLISLAHAHPTTTQQRVDAVNQKEGDGDAQG